MISIIAQGFVFGLVFAEMSNAPNELALSLNTGEWNHELSCDGGHFRETVHDRSRGLDTARSRCADDCERDGNCAYAVFFYSSGSFTGSPYRCSMRTAECAATVAPAHRVRSIYPRRTPEQNRAREQAAREAEEAECIKRTGQADCVPIKCEDIWARSICLEYMEKLNCEWDGRYAKCNPVEVTPAPTTVAPTTRAPPAPTTRRPIPRPIPEGCFAMDVMYPPQIFTNKGAGSPEECQLNCLEQVDCKFWTYNPANNHCYLNKDGVLESGDFTGVVSGPEMGCHVARTASTSFEKNELALELNANEWTRQRFCGTVGNIRTLRYDRNRGIAAAQSQCVSECNRTPECRYLTFQFSTSSFRSPPYRCTLRTDECGANVQVSNQAHWEIYYRM